MKTYTLSFWKGFRKRARSLVSGGTLITGLAITISVFAATTQPVAAPQNIDDLLDTPTSPTVQETSFIQQNIPETPADGYRITDEYTVTVTAYSSTPDQTDGDPHVTASNKHVQWGYVAANFLPFGTKIRIPQLFGNEIFTVEDRMNQRHENRVDVWFPTRSAAKRFGINYNIAIQVVEETQ